MLPQPWVSISGEKNTSSIATAVPPSSTNYEDNQMDSQTIWHAKEMRTSNVTPSLTKTEQTFAWTTGGNTWFLNTSSRPASILYLSTCADPSAVYAPLQSTLLLHVPRASCEECLSVFERYWGTHLAKGKTRQTLQFDTNILTFERRHTDAEHSPTQTCCCVYVHYIHYV